MPPFNNPINTLINAPIKTPFQCHISNPFFISIPLSILLSKPLYQCPPTNPRANPPSQYFCVQVLPEDWNKPFLFEELLESMENLMKNIDPTGLWMNKRTNKRRMTIFNDNFQSHFDNNVPILTTSPLWKDTHFDILCHHISFSTIAMQSFSSFYLF